MRACVRACVHTRHIQIQNRPSFSLPRGGLQSSPNQSSKQSKNNQVTDSLASKFHQRSITA